MWRGVEIQEKGKYQMNFYGFLLENMFLLSFMEDSYNLDRKFSFIGLRIRGEILE